MGYNSEDIKLCAFIKTCDRQHIPLPLCIKVPNVLSASDFVENKIIWYVHNSVIESIQDPQGQFPVSFQTEVIIAMQF